MRVVLLGPPGAGKGTQARRIAERLGVPAISIGEIFRAHVDERTHLGRQVKPYLDAGDFVPDEITVAVVRDRLAQADARSGSCWTGSRGPSARPTPWPNSSRGWRLASTARCSSSLTRRN